MNVKGYWVAFAMGVAAGVSVALLYAPQTGTRTRRQLRNGIDDAGDYLNDAGDYLRTQAERLGLEAQAAIRRTKGHVEDAVDAVNSAATTAIQQAKFLV